MAVEGGQVQEENMKIYARYFRYLACFHTPSTDDENWVRNLPLRNAFSVNIAMSILDIITN